MRQKSKEAIQWRPQLGTWVGRIREADGRRSPWTRLGTDNKELAQRAYDRWVVTGEPPAEGRGRRTFEEEAERVVMALLAGDEDKAKDRASRLRRYVYGTIGMLPVGDLEPHHVAAVLDASSRSGLSASTVHKLRVDISQVLAQLLREGQIPGNVARAVPLPPDARIDARPRVCLSDEQIVAFHERHGYREPLAMMALFCRQIAGHRTSDIHAADWSHIDTAQFATMNVRRPKTDGETGRGASAQKARRLRAYELVTHVVDEGLRPLIREYWLAQGSPKKGPVFPLLRDGVGGIVKKRDGTRYTRRASKAGERKRGTGNSYAKALRRMVWAAGIYDPMPGFDPAAPDKALCRLQTDTEETRRLDFQSFRRALVTAVADAQVPLPTQLAITGHTQLQTQQRFYLQKRLVQVPKQALPSVSVSAPLPPPTPPANGGVTPDAHALLAAIAALTARLDAQAPVPAGPQNPQNVGTNRPGPALRVLKGGGKRQG